MEEIIHVPARKFAVVRDATDAVFVVLLEQLHADNGEDEDHDEKNENQVPQSSHRGPDDLYQHVEFRPPPGQPEHSHLHGRLVDRQVRRQVRRQVDNNIIGI